MAEAKEFPPLQVRAIVNEVAALLKERKETVSVAETVRLDCLLLSPHYVLEEALLSLARSSRGFA